MQRISSIPCFHSLSTLQRQNHLSRSVTQFQSRQGFGNLANVTRKVPQLNAPTLSHAQDHTHLLNVHEGLQKCGILKISLGFSDDRSQYLQDLIVGLHKCHGHELPITHSSSRGWFWDVRPSSTFQSHNQQARSETMEEFPWHTDCSYEDPLPRFFALHVLQHDRYGGGVLSVLSVDKLSDFLSPATRLALLQPEYCISVPPEFVKNSNQKNVIGSILAADEERRSNLMRYRADIMAPMSERAFVALEELARALRQFQVQTQSVIHLTPNLLPQGSIILLDNRRWLHARSHINDPERHLRRVRWGAIPFTSIG